MWSSQVELEGSEAVKISGSRNHLGDLLGVTHWDLGAAFLAQASPCLLTPLSTSPPQAAAAAAGGAGGAPKRWAVLL